MKFTLTSSLLATVPHLDLDLHQMDVVTGFLNGDLDEVVHMKVSDGVSGIDRKSTIRKLIKLLNGLKHMHWRWNAKIDSSLNHLGFTSSPASLDSI